MHCTKERLDKILAGDVDVLNELLSEVASKTVEATLRSIPVMLGKLVEVSTVTTELVSKVYNDNPDFKQYKELVVITIQEVESDNPGLGYQEVVDKAVPIIKSKIAEYEAVAGISSSNPSPSEIVNRMNGAI